MFHFRRTSADTASPHQGRHGKRQTPPPVPAAFGPMPDHTTLYAGHTYLSGSVESVRRHAETLRAEAADHDSRAADELGWASRKRLAAEDYDRIAALAEADALGVLPTGFVPAEAPSSWVCPCGCGPDSCLYCDAECACGADCPNCKHLPRLGAGPADPMAGQIVHFNDGVGFWPPCSEREFATWSTADPSRVTCRACLAAMSAWTPPSEADATGRHTPLTAPPVADPAMLEAIRGGSR